MNNLRKPNRLEVMAEATAFMATLGLELEGPQDPDSHEIRVCDEVGVTFELYKMFEDLGGRIGMHRDGRLYCMLNCKDVSEEYGAIVNSLDNPVLDEFERLGGRISIEQSGRPHLEVASFASRPGRLEMHRTRRHHCVIEKAETEGGRDDGAEVEGDGGDEEASRRPG